jgi:hypothetical protein
LRRVVSFNGVDVLLSIPHSSAQDYLAAKLTACS